MKGNFHVQFLGEGVAATSPPYPTPGGAIPWGHPATWARLPDVHLVIKLQDQACSTDSAARAPPPAWSESRIRSAAAR